MKRLLFELSKNQGGQALPIVIVLLVVGALLALPSLRHVSTALFAGEAVKKDVRAVYAADAGIEDAIWRLRNDTSFKQDVQSGHSQPYTLGQPINGMTVTVNVQVVPYLAEYKIGKLEHQEWLDIDKSCIEVAPGDWVYTLTITDLADNGGNPKNYNVMWLAIDLPAGLEYTDYPNQTPFCSLCTNPNTYLITDQPPTDITLNAIESGIRLLWSGSGNHALFTIQDATDHTQSVYTFSFHLTELENFNNPNPIGLFSMYVKDELKYVTDSWAYVIEARAVDARGIEQAKLTAGAWVSIDANTILIRSLDLAK